MSDSQTALTPEGVLSPSQAAGAELRGELSVRRRGGWAVTLLGLSGLLLFKRSLDLVLRWVFGRRRLAFIEFDPAGLSIRVRRLLLGRTVGEEHSVLPFDGLTSISRDVRYAGAPLYLGLIALILGTALGFGLLLDGVVAGASPSAIVTGLGLIALGVALDFAATSLTDSARGRCRLVIHTQKGPTWTIRGLEPVLVDRLLSRLEARLNTPGEQASP
jgi:hypothetical protein